MKFIFNDFCLTPYTRLTQRGKFVVPKAKKYIQNQQALSWGYKAVMLEHNWAMFPPHTPLYVKLRVCRPDVYIFDLDNALKAVLDAAQNVVFLDDRYVIEIRTAVKIKGRAALEVEFGLVAENQIQSK